MEALRPDNMAAALAKLAIDYALFDASHGDGKELDAAYLSPYLEACFASPELANVSFGVAGGLRGDRVLQHLPAVLENYPIGWDAEAQLRSVRPDSSRPLDLMRVAEYIHASAEVTSCYNR